MKSLQLLVVYTFFTGVTLVSLMMAVVSLAFSGDGFAWALCLTPLFALTGWAAILSYRDVCGLLPAPKETT
ncbi:TPA: hypothetical protein L5U90_003491 [Pseudomonas aeruginosa]|nr:hypothetical protein [Pseudomonas aeruginosa]